MTTTAAEAAPQISSDLAQGLLSAAGGAIVQGVLNLVEHRVGPRAARILQGLEVANMFIPFAAAYLLFNNMRDTGQFMQFTADVDFKFALINVLNWYGAGAALSLLAFIGGRALRGHRDRDGGGGDAAE